MKEEQGIREASSLSSRQVYEVIRREGDEELKRPTNSLIWSGTAAGILISFSVLGEAVLRTHLPNSSWRFLIENFGYSFGFLLVILGRMQLFTENTITTILPLANQRSLSCLLGVLRLWGIVLAANVVGAALAAGFIAYSGAFSDSLLDYVNELSAHATGFAPMEAFVRAIPAGILIASIVWMLPSQPGNDVVVIVLFTWLIAAGDFTHVIAGSVEMWYMLFEKQLSVTQAVFGFFVPVLFGNIFGGTAIFTMLAWGQVIAEIED